MDTHGFLQPDCKPTIKKTENHLSLSIYMDTQVNDRSCLSRKPDEVVKSKQQYHSVILDFSPKSWFQISHKIPYLEKINITCRAGDCISSTPDFILEGKTTQLKHLHTTRSKPAIIINITTLFFIISEPTFGVLYFMLCCLCSK